MNRPSIALLGATTVLLLFSSCAQMPPPAPGSAAYRGAEEPAYRRGYHHGFQDGKRGRDDDYEQFYKEYDERTEKAFERGYTLGYETGEDQADATEDDRDLAYSHGQEAGQNDASYGVPPLYQRHRHMFTQETEARFAEGYRSGYQAGRD